MIGISPTESMIYAQFSVRLSALWAYFRDIFGAPFSSFCLDFELCSRSKLVAAFLRAPHYALFLDISTQTYVTRNKWLRTNLLDEI